MGGLGGEEVGETVAEIKYILKNILMKSLSNNDNKPYFFIHIKIAYLGYEEAKKKLESFFFH